MSAAYECDRCGMLYRSKEGWLGSRRKTEITIDLHPIDQRRLELCDKCQQELLNWLCEENRFKMEDLI